MKRIVSIILVTAAILSLAACQATPEKVTVVQKDTERMIEKAAENGAGLSALTLPEGNFTYEESAMDGKLKITANAKLTVPDAKALPVVRASMGCFTQEQVTGMFDLLFPDEKPHEELSQVETKADLQQGMIDLQKQYADGEYDGTDEEYEAELARLQQWYNEAPETQDRNGGVSDGTLKHEESDDGKIRESLWVKNDDFQLTLNTYPEKQNTSRLQFYSISDARSYSLRNMVKTDGTDLSETVKQDLTISYDDAAALCNDFLAAGSDGEFQIADAYIIDDTGADEVKGTNYAYVFFYVRTYNGIPMLSDSITRKEPFSGETGEGFSVPWSYEITQIIVDNDGIAGVDWWSPIDAGEVVEENAALLPFIDITDIFAGMMKTGYSTVVQDVFDGEVSLDLQVDEVKLMLVRVREQNGKQTDGLLVPVWVFYGYCVGTGKDGAAHYLDKSAAALNAMAEIGTEGSGTAVEGGGTMSVLEQFYEGNDKTKGLHRPLLAINAIDGSIIDLTKGY